MEKDGSSVAEQKVRKYGSANNKKSAQKNVSSIKRSVQKDAGRAQKSPCKKKWQEHSFTEDKKRAETETSHKAGTNSSKSGNSRKAIRDGRAESRRMSVKNGVCPYAKQCGGCDYQGMEYSAQLKRNRNM